MCIAPWFFCFQCPRKMHHSAPPLENLWWRKCFIAEKELLGVYSSGDLMADHFASYKSIPFSGAGVTAFPLCLAFASSHPRESSPGPWVPSGKWASDEKLDWHSAYIEEELVLILKFFCFRNCALIVDLLWYTKLRKWKKLTSQRNRYCPLVKSCLRVLETCPVASCN